ncbi:MAG: YbdD/YjiX family protein [Methylococcaceae bacterium]|jgi:uncharacterized short protein YbdD (DUF466 family)|nr:YbdD/YjiX family protein [Methylococcaceae bacterium]
MIRKAWVVLRRVCGDDAYERYLAHWREQHQGEGLPMDRKTFHASEIQRRWNGIRRCC